jgi:pectin methylesterase-like acyl-CoA thioesterase
MLWFMRRVPLPSEGLYPLRTLACALLLSPLTGQGQVTLQVPSQYPTIQSAVDAVPPSNGTQHHTIQISAGLYPEAILIPSEKGHLSLIPDPSAPPGPVIIRTSGGLNNVPLTVFANDVVIRDITLHNTKHNQSLIDPVSPGYCAALWVLGKHTAIFRTQILGWQDTIWVHDNAQVYITESEIAGFWDYVFGTGTAFIERSTIRMVPNLVNLNQGGVIAAPATPADLFYGLVFSECALTRDAGLPDASSYLMRAWGPSGRADFINCRMDTHISSTLWLEWSPLQPNTNCRANEYQSMNLNGTPKNMTGMAWWGHHLGATDAEAVNIPNVLEGWKPDETGDRVHLLNVSTRVFVQDGDSVEIGGFIVNGPDAKKVVLRGIGPSLAQSGIADPLSDPRLILFDSAGNILAVNEGWTSQYDELVAAGLAPAHERDSAMVATLAPGAYTVMLESSSQSPGTGLFELYDLAPLNSETKNLSTRGRVGTGDHAMIAGFAIGGDRASKVIVRAIGPSLAANGVSDPLLDPALELYAADGSLLFSNDNWRSTDEESIVASGLPPSHDAEAAIIATLNPGSYTAILRGTGNTVGNALVEVFRLQD